MTHLETTVEREAGLRAAMDRELGDISSKLSAHQRSLNALAEVQGDHTRRLTRIETRLDGVEGRLGNVEARLGNVEARLGNVEADLGIVKGDLVTVKAGVHTIVDLLDANLAKKSLADRLAGRFARRG
ncbi:MAG: hypothetical protein J2P26_03600 [Nocardiopsaceae bacterium]|nr:hypothetical protein [Nocardiopsaceae bacterium]